MIGVETEPFFTAGQLNNIAELFFTFCFMPRVKELIFVETHLPLLAFSTYL